MTRHIRLTIIFSFFLYKAQSVPYFNLLFGLCTFTIEFYGSSIGNRRPNGTLFSRWPAGILQLSTTLVFQKSLCHFLTLFTLSMKQYGNYSFDDYHHHCLIEAKRLSTRLCKTTDRSTTPLEFSKTWGGYKLLPRGLTRLY